MAQQDLTGKKHFNDLMEEFQKERPSQDKIKGLFQILDFKYTPDPVEQMMIVLSKCAQMEKSKTNEAESL